MIDNTIFEDLSKVDGYLGAVVSDFTGEVLISDNRKVKNLDRTSMSFNEIFRNIHDLTENMKLGHSKTLQIESERASIVMLCNGVDDRVHLHAFAIVAKGGAIALAKLALRNILNKTVKELSE